MISIQTLFLRLNEDLIQKGKGAYTTNDTFNRDVESGQYVFQNQLISILEASGDVVDSLSPFIKEKILTINNFTVTKPTDYRRWLDLKYQIVTYVEGEPVVDWIKMDYVSVNEEYVTVDSPIRKPNVNKRHLIYSMRDDVISVPEVTGRVKLRYISLPPVAIRAVIPNEDTDEDDYDPDDSIDLVWNAQDLDNFVNVMLRFKGIEIKDGDILNYVK